MSLRSFLSALAWRTPGASGCVHQGPPSQMPWILWGPGKVKKKKKARNWEKRQNKAGEGIKLTTNGLWMEQRRPSRSLASVTCPGSTDPPLQHNFHLVSDHQALWGLFVFSALQNLQVNPMMLGPSE